MYKSLVSSVFAFTFALGCSSQPAANALASDAAETPAASAGGEAAPAPTGDAQPASDGDTEAGKAVYKQHCLSCHQADGSGMNGMLAPDFTENPDILAKPDEELLGIIRDGETGSIGAMPGWEGVLDGDEKKAVLAYMREAFGE